jgi:DNA-binding HxlR family transcriptional regulator
MTIEIAADDTEPTAPCNFRLAFIRGALLLQEKWVLMIVFDLMEGPRSFSQLMRKGSINTTTLTQRLNLLEKAKVLVKTVHSTMPPRTSYELTDSGRELITVVQAIRAWSEKNLPDLSASELCDVESVCPGAD